MSRTLMLVAIGALALSCKSGGEWANNDDDVRMAQGAASRLMEADTSVGRCLERYGKLGHARVAAYETSLTVSGPAVSVEFPCDVPGLAVACSLEPAAGALSLLVHRQVRRADKDTFLRDIATASAAYTKRGEAIQQEEHAKAYVRRTCAAVHHSGQLYYEDQQTHKQTFIDDVRCTLEVFALDDSGKVTSAVQGVGTGTYKGPVTSVASLAEVELANKASEAEALAAAKADLTTKLKVQP